MSNWALENFIMVDVEADGPIPGEYSMFEFGAVLVRDPSVSFHGRLIPISEKWVPEALAVSGRSREELFHAPYQCPIDVMTAFLGWIARHVPKRPMFISDNNGFDWQFVNWYFHRYLGANPFGFSSTNLGSLYKGFVQDMRKNFKHLRETKHDHNPVNDARGNAEAMRKIVGCWP